MKDKETEFRELLIKANKLIAKEEKNVEILMIENEKKKEEINKMKLRIAELDGESNVLKQRFGWEGITDEEMKWVMKKYPKGFGSFVPTLITIREEFKREKEL